MQLPAYSSSGKNVLGCKVNGQVHLYSGIRTLSNDNGVDYFNGNTEISVDADNSSYNDYMRILFYHLNNLSVGTTYYFTNDSISYATYLIGNGSQSYTTGSGYVKFTRLDNMVAAGIFEYTAYSITGDSVKVTEGRFDVKSN